MIKSKHVRLSNEAADILKDKRNANEIFKALRDGLDGLYNGQDIDTGAFVISMASKNNL